MEQWRIDLNNYAQRNGLSPYLQWGQAAQTGPPNEPMWTISVFFNGVEFGRGSANNVGQARELAAEMALKALWQQRGY